MEVITYGNVDLLASILNGVAFLFHGSQAGSFKGMMVTVGLIGFIIALIAYAFAPQKLVGWYWLATVMVVATLIAVPRVDVQVVDRLQNCGPTGSCVKLVPDVPYGLAALAALTSQIGDKLTELYETTFQSVTIRRPDGANSIGDWGALGFRGNGMMFGNKLVRDTARVSFPAADFRYDMIKYMENCAMPDLSDGTLSADTLRLQTDIWAYLSTGGNPARYSPTHTGSVIDCAHFRDYIDGQIDGATNQTMGMLARRISADAISPETGVGMTDAGARSRIESQLVEAYDRTQLGGAAMGAAALVRQNAMINVMADSSGVYSQRTDDPSSLLLGLAEAQAKVSTNTAWITSAKVAEDAMPMIRNGIEAILYACFPIVVLIALVTSGVTTMRLIKSYAGALLWVQLWPPLYAVLNHMASVASSHHIGQSGAMPDGTRGLSLLTSASIYENSISDMAVVGYLTIAIPVIAWSLIKGMDSIASGALAGAGAFSAGSSAGAAAAASGNISLGNAAMDQVNLAPSYRDANFRTHDDGVFQTTTRFAAGQEYETSTMRTSNIGAETMMTNDRSQALAAQANEAHRLTESAQKLESEAVGASFGEAMSMARQATHGWSTGENWQENHGGATASAFDKGIAIRQSLQKQFGNQLSESMLDQITTSAVVSGGGSLGLGGGGGVGGSFSAGYQGSRNNSESGAATDAVSRATSVANEMAKQGGVKLTASSVDEFAHSGSLSEMAAGGKTSTAGFSASMDRTHQASEAVSMSVSHEHSVMASAQAAESESVRTRLNAGNFTYEQMGLSGSADARMEWAQKMKSNPTGANMDFSQVSRGIQPGSGGGSEWSQNFTQGPGGVTTPDASRLGGRLDQGAVDDMGSDYRNGDPAARFGAPQVAPGGAAEGRVVGANTNNRAVVGAQQGGMTPGSLPGGSKVDAGRVENVVGAAKGVVSGEVNRAYQDEADMNRDARTDLTSARDRVHGRRKDQ